MNGIPIFRIAAATLGPPLLFASLFGWRTGLHTLAAVAVIFAAAAITDHINHGSKS